MQSDERGKLRGFALPALKPKEETRDNLSED